MEKKVEEKKDRNYRATFRKREHRCRNNRGKDTCMNLHRVINEETSENPVYMDENSIIYNSIYNFKDGMPTNKKMANLFEMRIVCKE